MGGGRSSLVKGRRAWATAETLLAEDHRGDRSPLCEGEGSRRSADRHKGQPAGGELFWDSRGHLLMSGMKGRF